MPGLEIAQAPKGMAALAKIDAGAETLLHAAGAFGDMHGYAVELAMQFKAAPLLVLGATMRDALLKLAKHKLISAKEESRLATLADAVTAPDSLNAAHKALREIEAALDKTRTPVAAMLIAIAADSIARDLASHTGASKLPAGAHAIAAKKIFAWVADVGAGAAGAAAGGAVANVPGALILGGLAAAAASGAVLS